MSFHVNDNGTLREIRRIFVNDAGTLREIESIHGNDAGTLRQLFQRYSLSAGPGGFVSSSDNASPLYTQVGIRFLSTREIQTGTIVDSGPIAWQTRGFWIDTTDFNAANFSVRFTNQSGLYTFDSGPAEDVWSSLNSDRTWLWEYDGGDPFSGSFSCDFEVREDGGGADTASASYTFQLSQSP